MYFDDFINEESRLKSIEIENDNWLFSDINDGLIIDEDAITRSSLIADNQVDIAIKDNMPKSVVDFLSSPKIDSVQAYLFRMGFLKGLSMVWADTLLYMPKLSYAHLDNIIFGWALKGHSIEDLYLYSDPFKFSAYHIIATGRLLEKGLGREDGLLMLNYPNLKDEQISAISALLEDIKRRNSGNRYSWEPKTDIPLELAEFVASNALEADVISTVVKAFDDGVSFDDIKKWCKIAEYTDYSNAIKRYCIFNSLQLTEIFSAVLDGLPDEYIDIFALKNVYPEAMRITRTAIKEDRLNIEEAKLLSPEFLLPEQIMNMRAKINSYKHSFER